MAKQFGSKEFKTFLFNKRMLIKISYEAVNFDYA